MNDDLDTLALRYIEQGYSAAADGALITPNGYQHRGLVKIGGNVYMPEQIAARIREMQQARAKRSDGRRDLRGLIMHGAPVKL